MFLTILDRLSAALKAGETWPEITLDLSARRIW
jgi:hypothetical protein